MFKHISTKEYYNYYTNTKEIEKRIAIKDHPLTIHITINNFKYKDLYLYQPTFTFAGVHYHSYSDVIFIIKQRAKLID